VPRQLIPRAANGPGDIRLIQYDTLADEVAGITKLVKDMVDSGTPPGDILVLAQRGAIGTPIYESLHGHNVPVKSYYSESELDAPDAQRRFALLKLLIDRDDRVALRWLSDRTVTIGTRPASGGSGRIVNRPDFHLGRPWSGFRLALWTFRTGNIVASFEQILAELNKLGQLPDLAAVIDQLFPAGDDTVRDLRDLAIEVVNETGADDPGESLIRLMEAISKPEVPTEVNDVRIMSLHKSKGLNAPVTIIAGCVEGLMPKQPERGTPASVAAAQIEEQRRLFFVGITRVKADPAAGKPGSLVLTYSRRMPLATAMGAGILPAGVSYSVARLNASRFIRELGNHAPAPIAG
jgi:DNA helicase II / ATP-dependent DNA helicase PcrA